MLAEGRAPQNCALPCYRSDRRDWEQVLVKRSAGLAALLLAGCVTPLAPVTHDSAGLSPAAESLSYVMANGCLPYALGDAGEVALVRAGMRRQLHWSFPAPPGPQHLYRSNYPGDVQAQAHRRSCILRVRGNDLPGLQAGVDAALRAQFTGVSPAPLDLSGGRAPFPLERAVCARGLRILSYGDPADGVLHGGYNVSILPSPACD
jgi:hypothetical protein